MSEFTFEIRFIAGLQSASGDDERKFVEPLSLTASLAALRAGYEPERRVINFKYIICKEGIIMHTVELQNMDVGLTRYLFRSTYENDWLDILEYINVIATIFEPMEVLTNSKDDETEPVLAAISESDDIYAIPESNVVIVRGLNKLFNSVKFQIVFLKDSDEIQIYISTDDLEN